jgi:hypothetical protein
LLTKHVPPKHGIVSVITNLWLLVAGACFAIAVRLLGYSYVSGKTLFDALHQWKSDLTFRVAGNLDDGRAATVWDTARALIRTRADPFYGVLSKNGADVFYALGFLGWVLLLPLCWCLLKKKNLRFQRIVWIFAGRNIDSGLVSHIQRTHDYSLMDDR